MFLYKFTLFVEKKFEMLMIHFYMYKWRFVVIDNRSSNQITLPPEK